MHFMNIITCAHFTRIIFMGQSYFVIVVDGKFVFYNIYHIPTIHISEMEFFFCHTHYIVKLLCIRLEITYILGLSLNFKSIKNDEIILVIVCLL